MAAPADLTPAQLAAWNSVAHISSFWGRQVGPAPFTSSGMENRAGVICFQNSIIQCLLHAPKFINWLEQHHVNEQDHVECRILDCIACSLRSLSIEYWKPRKDEAAIHQQVEKYRQRHSKGVTEVEPDMDFDVQQDAHELYENILARMIEQCDDDDTLLQALFRMERTSLLTCPLCGNESPNSVVESSLVCPISQPGKLIDTISANALGSETIEWNCSNASCEGKSGQRSHIINVPPEILVIQLGRFGNDPRTGGPKKIKSVVSIPEQLDISQFCEGTGGFKYRLFAVIKHLGTLNSGHYIVFTEGPGQRWEQIDDDEVTSSTINEATSSKAPFLPYIMFYKKFYGDSEAAVNFPHSSLRSSTTERVSEIRSWLRSSTTGRLSETQSSLRSSTTERLSEIPSTAPPLISDEIGEWLRQETPESEPPLSSKSTLSESQYSPEALIPKFLSKSPSFMPLVAKHVQELLSSSPPLPQPMQKSPSSKTPPRRITIQSLLLTPSPKQPPPSKVPSPNISLGSSTPPPVPRKRNRTKYLVPENPTRVQPRRACRGGAEIERPTRVQPRRACHTREKRNEIEEKAKVTKRKGGKGRKR